MKKKYNYLMLGAHTIDPETKMQIPLDKESYDREHRARVKRGVRNKSLRYDSGRADMALRKF